MKEKWTRTDYGWEVFPPVLFSYYMNDCPKPSVKNGCSLKQALVNQKPVYDRGHKSKRRRKRKTLKSFYD